MKYSKKQLDEIIHGRYIYPVFQPIISLKTGNILGYEALTRVDYPNETNKASSKLSNGEKPLSQIEVLFQSAEYHNCIWDLDKLCRKRALKVARGLGLKHKLFVNINPEVLHDDSFKTGYTMKKIQQYRMNPSDIVFEITERCRARDEELFLKSIEHYRYQDYQVALDDLGSGYSGLNLVCKVNPDFIKIDMELIHNIENDKIKQTMIKSLVDFSNTSGSKLIAEGIETKEELTTLINLGVSYGQGYFIGYPEKVFTKPSNVACSVILDRENKNDNNIIKSTGKKVFSPNLLERKLESPHFPSLESRAISDVCTLGNSVKPSVLATDVLKLFHEKPDSTAIAVVDEKNNLMGCLFRSSVTDSFGGQYGFSLNYRKTAADIMETDFLAVESIMAVEEVSELATSRDEKHLYNPVIIKKDNKYIGIVTIKDLLNSIVAVEVTERTLEITRKNRMLQDQKVIADKDLHMAELVQKSFYPSVAPCTKDWKGAFLFKPLSAVSGDVYDFYYDENGELKGVSLFDVSGHGVASGLVGILARSTASNCFSHGTKDNLPSVMENINRTLIQGKGSVENYLTGVILRICGDTIEYVNAGHTDVFIKHANSSQMESQNFTDYSDNSVFILGEEDSSFRGHFLGIPDLPVEFGIVQKKLEPGDTIILYTDCLTESRNLAGDELGQDLLKKIIQKSPCITETQKNDKSFPSNEDSILGKILSNEDSIQEEIPSNEESVPYEILSNEDSLPGEILSYKDSLPKEILTHIMDSFEAFTEAVPLRDDLTIIVLQYKPE